MTTTGKQQAEVIVNFGDGPNRRARILAGCLLFYGYRRRKAFKRVDIGLIHLAEKLPGIGGKRFHIPPLPFSVECIKSKG